MKPANKVRRREAREQRRLEWGAARAAFLLAGGHKDWLVPFHMNWRQQMAYRTAEVESGPSLFAQPRNHYGNDYKWTGTTTGRYHSGTIDYYQTLIPR